MPGLPRSKESFALVLRGSISRSTGSEEERLKVFRKVRDQIREHIERESSCRRNEPPNLLAEDAVYSLR